MFFFLLSELVYATRDFIEPQLKLFQSYIVPVINPNESVEDSMSAIKVAVAATAAVAGTLVVVNMVQRYRQKKAMERFEKGIDDMVNELNRAFGIDPNQPFTGFGPL